MRTCSFWLYLKGVESGGLSENVVCRIARLNPNPKMGVKIRGWHPVRSAQEIMMMYNVVSFSDFRKYSPSEIWRKAPRGSFLFKGRRKYMLFHEVVRLTNQHKEVI